MAKSGHTLNRLFVGLPVDGGDGRRTLELEVAIFEMLITDLRKKKKPLRSFFKYQIVFPTLKARPSFDVLSPL